MKTSVTALMALVAALSANCANISVAVSAFLATAGKHEVIDRPDLTERLAKLVQERRTDRYALLLCGNCEGFYGNLPHAYQTLLEEGYDGRRNVIILASLGQYLKEFPVAGSATVDTVTEVLEAFQKALTPESELFVYVTDHGKQHKLDSGEAVSTIVLEGGEQGFQEMTDRDFVALLAKIPGKKVFALFDECYGRRFADLVCALANGQTDHLAEKQVDIVGISVSPPQRLANDTRFSDWFFRAFRELGQDITIRQAHEYARQKDSGTRKGNNNPYLCESKPGAADRGL